MRIGIIVNGGTAPGINAAIEGITIEAYKRGMSVVGFLGGYRGAYKNEVCLLTPGMVDNIRYEPGSKLLTSRMNPYKGNGHKVKRVVENIRKNNIDALITIGGDDTNSTALKLYENEEIPVVGFPKTVDNNLNTIDNKRIYYTLGFHSAVIGASEYVKNLIPVGVGHKRILIVEVSGRKTSWLTLYTAYRTNPLVTIIRETPCDIDKISDIAITSLDALDSEYKDNMKEGNDFKVKKSPIILVAEGVELDREFKVTESDGFGHLRLDKKRVGEKLEASIKDSLDKRYDRKIEIRTERPGRIVNGRRPISLDVNKGMVLGESAVSLVDEGMYGYAPLGKRKDGSIVIKKLEDLVKIMYVPQEMVHNCQMNGLNFG